MLMVRIQYVPEYKMMKELNWSAFSRHQSVLRVKSSQILSSMHSESLYLWKHTSQYADESVVQWCNRGPRTLTTSIQCAVVLGVLCSCFSLLSFFRSFFFFLLFCWFIVIFSIIFMTYNLFVRAHCANWIFSTSFSLRFFAFFFFCFIALLSCSLVVFTLYVMVGNA